VLAGLTFIEFVGIVSIIGVGIAGLGVFLDWRYRRRPRAEREPHRTQLAEDASADLNKMEIALGDVWVAVHQLGRGIFKSERGPEVLQALQGAGEALDDRHSRLKVAFGPKGAISESFGEASQAAVETFRSLKRIRDLHTDAPRPGDEIAERQADGLFEIDRGVIDRSRNRFKDARARFESVAGNA
jgi:hypothetical protein